MHAILEAFSGTGRTKPDLFKRWWGPKSKGGGSLSTLSSLVIQNWSHHPNHLDQVPLGASDSANILVSARRLIAQAIGLVSVVPDFAHLSLQLASCD